MWIPCYRGLVFIQVFTILVLFISRPQPKIESRLGEDVTAFAHAAGAATM